METIKTITEIAAGASIALYVPPLIVAMLSKRASRRVEADYEAALAAFLDENGPPA